MQSTVDLFVKLFRGRGDARGSWTGPAIRANLTPEHFADHLSLATEDAWFGVYNVIGSQCSWGCVDIDIDDLPLARNIWSALAFKGIVGWIEQTTRGYHVWVFPEQPLVDASIMRRALTAACHAVGYSPKEVFPKQTSVSSGGLGNFVRLPYNGYWSDGEHVPRMMVDHISYVTAQRGDPLARLLFTMNESRTPTLTLARVAALLPDLEQRTLVTNVEDDNAAEAVTKLGGLPYIVWRDGPLPGSDRSTTLVHLARLCAEQDLPPEDTAAIVASADRRWGKDFLDRGATGVAIIQRIISKAYS